jgi:hypothetical protein
MAGVAQTQQAAGLGSLDLLLPLIDKLLTWRRPDSFDSGTSNSLRQRLNSIEDQLDTLDRRVTRIERRLKIKSSDGDGESGGDGVKLPQDGVPGRFGSAAAIANAADVVIGTLDAAEGQYRRRMRAYSQLTDKTAAEAKQEKEILDKMKKFLTDHGRSLD